jgi:hypothetical protein
VSPTSKKDLARRRKRLTDAGMRTWYGSRINDTTLAELVAAGHKARFGVEPICRVLSQHGCPGGLLASLKGLSVDRATSVAGRHRAGRGHP